jgi:tRNA-dihydrouridine synthase A
MPLENGSTAPVSPSAKLDRRFSIAPMMDWSTSKKTP